MHETVIPVFAVSLTVLGLSYFLRPRAWVVLYDERKVRTERFMPAGLGMVVAGLLVALTVDDWSSTWPIFITAFGWLMVLEGALLAIAPSLASRFTRLLGSGQVTFIRLGGLLVFVLGCLLCWEYLIREYF